MGRVTNQSINLSGRKHKVGFDTMEIQIKKLTTIQPAKETPKHCLKTSVLDLLTWPAHASLLYFYRRPKNFCNFFESDFLKESLSRVLVPFYPAAGRFGRDENGRLEIHCNGKGVLFIEAETSCVLDYLGDFDSGSKLQKLVPTVDYTKDISSLPLVLLQLTRFKCGGVCLVFAIHHTFMDLASMAQLMDAWAEMTRGVPISNPPYFDPTVTLLEVGVPTSPKFHHIEYDPPPSMNANTQNMEFQSNHKPISYAILHLSVDQINTLIAESMQEHEPTAKFTKFEILAAHIWRCLCKSRGLSNDQFTKLHMPINGRSRLNPQLPSGYIGNVLFTGTSVALAGDIQSEPLNFTVKRIQKAIKRMDNEYLKSALAYLNQLPDPTVARRESHTFKCPNLNISGVSNMPIYDANFGWGRPLFCSPLPRGDGVIHIFPSPRNDGNLYLSINLETQHFHHFKKLFYEIFPQCQSARSRY